AEAPAPPPATTEWPVSRGRARRAARHSRERIIQPNGVEHAVDATREEKAVAPGDPRRRACASMRHPAWPRLRFRHAHHEELIRAVRCHEGSRRMDAGDRAGRYELKG